MTTAQTPIQSGFGASSTAAEVLAGIDLGGRRAIVTGGYSGLGFETVRALAEAGAEVIVPARRVEVAQEALAEMGQVRIEPMDLGDLESVRRFAERIVGEESHIDMVINGAGIMACPEARVGPGWEAQFATNHLGHFALINRLWPVLAGDARVVSVSSGGHGICDILWDDPHFTSSYDKWRAYGQAKTANVLFAVELDRLGAPHGVRAFSLHPGSILTSLQRHLPIAEMVAAGWVDEDGQPTDDSFKSTMQGAATQVWAATSPQLRGMGGVYCEDCDIAPVAEVPGEKGVRRYAMDGDSARRLWTMSVALTGVDAFAGG